MIFPIVKDNMSKNTEAMICYILFSHHSSDRFYGSAQNCGSYSFDDRIQILGEIICSHQYLSIDLKKSLPRPHKLKKIVNMNADISETIKDRELGFQI